VTNKSESPLLRKVRDDSRIMGDQAYGDWTPWKRSSGLSTRSVRGRGCRTPSSCDLPCISVQKNVKVESSYTRNVTGTLRSQERPKVKSSLLSLSIVIIHDTTKDRARLESGGAVTCQRPHQTTSLGLLDIYCTRTRTELCFFSSMRMFRYEYHTHPLAQRHSVPCVCSPVPI